MKNIVFVIESLNLGGAEKSLVTLLQNLDYSKYKVDLVVFQEDGFFKNYLHKEVNKVVIKPPSLTTIDRIKFALKTRLIKNQHKAQIFWKIINKYLSSVDKLYDIAIAYNQGFATYYTEKCINAKVKYCWINTDYKNAGYELATDIQIYKSFDTVVAVSPEVKTGLEDELIKIDQKLNIEVIKDITDIEIVRKKANANFDDIFSNEKISLVTVGRLATPKGLILAINACEILVKKNYPIEWFVVGEGGERENLEKTIKEKNLSDSFQLVGAYPNPYPYMKNCDIYVQTSLFEGLGLTVIEASYLAKPIVCTNFPTAYTIIKNEETGLITEMNAEAIAVGIERLINDKDLRDILVSNLENLKNQDKEITLQKVDKLLNV